MREYLGYTLRGYDPCGLPQGMNQDLFCCDQRNRQLYTNLALNEALAKATLKTNSQDHSYNIARNYGGTDHLVPLELQTSGLVVPNSYNFPSMGKFQIPCSRLPCSINVPTGFPCVPK